MATIVSGSDFTRYSDAEITTGWSSWGGGGQGPQAEPDAFYQGVGSVSRKATAHGVGYTGTTGIDMSIPGRRVYLSKAIVNNFGTVTNLELRIGTDTSNHYIYQVANSGDNLYPAKGGFLITPINPNIAAHTSSLVGAFDTGSAGAFGAYVECGTSKTENLAVDAIDVGAGLFVYGGGTPEANATFDQFLELDEGNSNNRYGAITSLDGILTCVSKLIIGASSSLYSKTTQATTFEDSTKTIVFPDGFIEPGDVGIDCDINSGTTSISMSACNFLSRGVAPAGSVPDTRATFEIFGVSGSVLLDACTLSAFNYIILTGSNSSLVGCTVSDTRQLTQSSALLTACAFSNHATATSQSFLHSDNPALIVGCTFTSAGTGHAIELTTAGTFNFLTNEFNGYSALNEDGNSTLFNSSGGVITMSIQSGGDGDLTYRNSLGSSTAIESSLSITVTGLASFDPGTGLEYTEVRVLSAGTTDELAGVEDATTGEFTFGVSSGQEVDIVLHNLYYIYQRLDTYSSTDDASIPIQQVFDRNYTNP
jgi:hypothetical protein